MEQRTITVTFDKLTLAGQMEHLFTMLSDLTDGLQTVLHQQEQIMATNEEILAAAQQIQMSEEGEIAVIQQIIEKEQALDQTLTDLKAQVDQLNTDAMPQETRTAVNDLLTTAITQSGQNTAALAALVAPPPTPTP
jgi:hypothetical protein